MTAHWDSIVVGGGFFGASVATELATAGHAVLLLEREPQLLTRASYANQARVHGGYHYPRSYLTGNRSRANFSLFIREYEDAIDRSFRQLYAIARRSAVAARQFVEFCGRIEAPLRVADARTKRLFDDTLVEEVFEVEEFAFDAVRLRAAMAGRLEQRAVTVWTSASATRVWPEDEGLGVAVARAHGAEDVSARHVWNCTYSELNGILQRSRVPVIPLHYELAELALVEPPEELRHVGITVMDGPFFSIMPFPPRGLHTLSHVLYTPNQRWRDGEATDGVAPAARGTSRFDLMIRDARRYVPSLGTCLYRDSLWEPKALLPRSDDNDSRPILFRRDHGWRGLHCVLGGKVDNVFDVVGEVKAVVAHGAA